MTQTFSEILAEKIRAADGTPENTSANFYSGTYDSTCISDLLSMGFQPPIFRRGTYTQMAVQDTPDYILNEMQQQAVTFLNEYLIGPRRLTGHFSVTKLRRVYRLLAKKLHPDTGGSTELFRELHTQYKILLDFLEPIK